MNKTVIDPWRDYWRSSAVALAFLFIGVIGYVANATLQHQNELIEGQAKMNVTISKINERGMQNRQDIIDFKANLKDMTAKVDDLKVVVTRMESKD